MTRACSSRVAAAGLVALGLTAVAPAAVTFHPWQDTSLSQVVDQASRTKKLVVLVVTQPDWCPPCIRLDQRWLTNAGDTAVRDATKDALVLEVWGYDAAGAELLRRQEVRFQGTPTTHVFRPEHPGEPLGRAALLGSIVGAPDDYPAQLARIMGGHDPVADAKAEVEAAPDRVARGKALLALAALHAARGEADAASSALAAVQALPADGIDAASAAALAGAKGQAAWEQAATVDLRVRKDAAVALRGIDSYIATHGMAMDRVQDITYARAAALARLGRVTEALDAMERTHVDPGTADGHETFAYFCFRQESTEALLRGEARTREALAKFPDARAALQQALGRILRRQGRLVEAEAAFAESVRAARDDEQRLVNQGQLDMVRRELARAAAVARKG